MKTLGLRSATAALLLMGLARLAHANPITGSIGFAGTFSTDFNGDFTQATAFTAFDAYTFSATGDYAGVPLFAPAAFTPFGFADDSVTPLWSLGGGNYSFNATVVDVTTTPTTITAHGTGIAYLTGYDPTPGYWNLAGSGSDLSLTFASTSSTGTDGSGSTIPDGVPTVLLLGIAMLALAAFRWTGPDLASPDPMAHP